MYLIVDTNVGVYSTISSTITSNMLSPPYKENGRKKISFHSLFYCWVIFRVEIIAAFSEHKYHLLNY